MLLKPGDRLARKVRSGRATVDADIFRTIALQQLSIDACDVLARRGKAMFRSHPVVDADDGDPAETGDGNGFLLTPVTAPDGESAAVQIDQHALLVLRRDARDG